METSWPGCGKLGNASTAPAKGWSAALPISPRLAQVASPAQSGVCIRWHAHVCLHTCITYGTHLCTSALQLLSLLSLSASPGGSAGAEVEAAGASALAAPALAPLGGCARAAVSPSFSEAAGSFPWPKAPSSIGAMASEARGGALRSSRTTGRPRAQRQLASWLRLSAQLFPSRKFIFYGYNITPQTERVNTTAGCL